MLVDLLTRHLDRRRRSLRNYRRYLEIKTSSSRWMGRNFAWQRGFGIFGVSASNVDSVVRYIRTQEPHHRKMTFEQEFLALLDKHGVAYDPRYVFG